MVIPLAVLGFLISPPLSKTLWSVSLLILFAMISALAISRREYKYISPNLGYLAGYLVLWSSMIVTLKAKKHLFLWTAALHVMMQSLPDMEFYIRYRCENEHGCTSHTQIPLRPDKGFPLLQMYISLCIRSSAY